MPVAAHPGWGIVVDRKGNVFYTDLKQVWRLDPDGKKMVVVPNVHTHELYLDDDGTLYGEHLWYDGKKEKWGHYLWEFTDGKVVRPDAPGQAPGGILAIGPDHTLYLMSWGDLLNVTSAGQTHRVATGLNEHVWTSFMTQPWHYVMGLAVDRESNVYVANSGARKLKKVGRDGKVTVVLTARFPWSPTGVTTHNREVYVLEYTDTGGSVRVRKIDADGRISVI
jgi:sugar lactone lactonase YvrE